MDRLDLAIRRYQQILPQSPHHLDARYDPAMRALNVWLREDLPLALEDSVARPLFREHACWPIVALRSGACTPERDLIDRLETELVDCAKALRKLTRHRRLENRMRAMADAPTASTDSVRVGVGTLPRAVQSMRCEVDLEVSLSQVEALASGHGTELVNLDDYLEPQQEWFQVDEETWLQSADWIVSLNPELLPIGNFVVRCLLKRLRQRLDLLAAVRAAALAAAQQFPSSYRRDREALSSAWQTVSASAAELEQLFATDEKHRIRDACVVCTQAYAAFHPAPDLGWLGLEPSLIEEGQAALRARMTQLDNHHFFDRLATSLGDLRRLYLDADPGRSELEAAVATGGLVIDEGRHEAYWEGKLLQKVGRKQSWKFLVALARKARLRQTVEVRDLFGDKAVSDSAMSTAWDRLKDKLPASLWRLVKPGDEPRTYLLDLSRERIHILQQPRTDAI